MKILSCFEESGDIFFTADDRTLSQTGCDVIDHTQESRFGTTRTKACLLRGMLLNYTYNVFHTPPSFVVSFDGDLIVNTFHLQSSMGIEDERYEPYLLCGEDFITMHHVAQGSVRFTPPPVVELFRLFMLPEKFLEILCEYGGSFTDLARLVEEKRIGPIMPGPLVISPRMKVVIREIINHDSADGSIAGMFYHIKALELLYLQFEQLQSRRASSGVRGSTAAERERIHEAGKILRANYNNPPTVRQLAAVLAVNENKLKNGFRDVYHSSIHQYVIQVRIQKAIELIRENTQSMGEIASVVGYANQAHFTRAFKNVVGIPPSQYPKASSQQAPPFRESSSTR